MAINWEDVIKTTLATVGGSIALLGAAAWLIRAAISHALVLQTETFKMKLKSDADMEIEKLRSALQMTAVEHHVRFSKLHEKRAEVIAELYQRMVQMLEDAELFVRRQQKNTREEHLAALQKIWDLEAFIDIHRIYLPEQACTRLDTFINAAKHPLIRMGIYGDIKNPSEQIADEKIKALMDAFTAFGREIPEDLKVLQGEFRAMLGDESPTGSCPPPGVCR
jgi:hypothetical protein